MIGDHAFFDHDVAKNSNNPPPLGKTPGKNANHSDFAFLGGDLAKADDKPRPVGKNSREKRQSWPSRFLGSRSCQTQRQSATIGKNPSGNRQSWPFRFAWTALLPKFPTGWEKFQGKPPIMAIPQNSDDRIGRTIRVGEGGEENPAFGEAECRSQVRAAAEPVRDALVLPIQHDDPRQSDAGLRFPTWPVNVPLTSSLRPRSR